MGNRMGRVGSSNSIAPSPTDLSVNRFYENIRNEDQQILEFSSQLQRRDAVVEAEHSLPFSHELLKQVTGSLLDSNQQVVNMILKSKKKIWKNAELSTLVDDYFNSSLHTLDFCYTLHGFLANLKQNQALLQSALRRISVSQPGSDEYKKGMLELQSFKSDQIRFTEEVLKKFGNAHGEHVEILSPLQAQRSRLEKKLKKIRSWKRTASIVLTITYMAVLMGSIAAAIIAAPPVVSAVVAAVGAAATWAPAGRWIGALWKKAERTVREQKAVASCVEAGNLVAIRDFDNVRALVEGLEAELVGFVGKIEKGIGSEEVVTIESRAAAFTREVDELGAYVDCCSRNLHKARSVILEKVVKPSKH